MAQLIDFSGGINNSISKYSAPINTARYLLNADVKSYDLRSLSADTIVDTSTGYFTIFNDTILHFTSEYNFVQVNSTLYRTNGVSTIEYTNDGIAWYQLGIDKPTDMATSVITGQLSGTVSYTYTYYNSTTGAESKPVIFSSELVLTSNSVDISVSASIDPQVDTIRIYRLGINYTVMTLVVELPNTTTIFNDNLLDADLPGGVLDSTDREVSPIGASNIIEFGGMLFCSVNNKLYYSDIAFLDRWSPYNFINFNYNITGLGILSNGILVFSKYKTYIITGTDSTSFSKDILSNDIGCVNHKSINYIENNVLWASYSGICTTSGGSIRTLTRHIIDGIDFSTCSLSVVNNNIYYLKVGTSLLVYDNAFYYVDVDCTDILVNKSQIYYSNGTNIYTLYSSSAYREFIYKSPIISDGSACEIKNYNKFYITCEGTFTIDIYISEVLVATINVSTTTREFKVPQLHRVGYNIQFIIKGTGTISEIQYIVERRQNGR